MQCAFGLVLAFASRFRKNGWRGPRFPLRRGGVARSATAAVFAAVVAGLGAVAGELETIEIVSDPGDDNTYSSDGEDNTIIFRATWAALVSVRGADLIFTLGDEERAAFCPQTEDCNTCPVLQIECTYVVQPGDLDEDGVSIPPASVQHPFRGSITRNDSNINQATCTTTNTAQECAYAGMDDNAAHRVDGGPAESAEPEEPEDPDQGQRQRRAHRPHRLGAAGHRPAADRHDRRRGRRRLLPHRPRRQRHRAGGHRRPVRHPGRAARRQRRASSPPTTTPAPATTSASPRASRPACTTSPSPAPSGEYALSAKLTDAERPGRHRGLLGAAHALRRRCRCRPSGRAPCSPPPAASTRP